MSTFRERVQQIQTELSVIADEVSGVPQPGPGIAVPPPAPVSPWHRNPGTPYVAGESAADNPQRAKELAAQNRRVNGDHGAIADKDFSVVLALADFISTDTTTAEQAEAKVEASSYTTTDSTIYQIVLGQVNGDIVKVGLGGRPKLMYPGTFLADVIHAIGQPIGGNVAGV